MRSSFKDENMIDAKVIQVNSPEVIFEVFDDEVVLINLENGNYYCIANTAAVIWEHSIHRSRVADIVSGVSKLYRGNKKEIGRAVVQFLEELEEEALIKGVDASESTAEIQPDKEVAGEQGGQKPEFDTPVLQRFTDMQALLLLDPIHEVGEAGWPTPPATAPDSSEQV
jgi:hypothetical protein